MRLGGAITGLGLVGALCGAVLLPAACSQEPYCFGCGNGGTTTTDGGGSTPNGCVIDDDCFVAGQSCCAGVCIDTTTDVDNCGKCGKVCDAPAGSLVQCVAGECKEGCPDGKTDCNQVAADGCEVDLLTDKLNCGECGVICLAANATVACDTGACEIQACKPGFADCNGEFEDGCEINVGTDPEHCADCDTVCNAPMNQEALCLGGVCGIGECAEGFGDCNDEGGDGCETDLLTDGEHCGTCDIVCDAPPHAAAACKNGACGVGTCEAGYADCDQSVWSGCEAELDTDKNNCGACQAACLPLKDGQPACVKGDCVIGSCDPGHADCDNSATNGCETDLASSLTDCGTCGNACAAVNNGKPGCVGYSCVIASCDAGYDDCYGGAVDGCETHLLSDIGHCGACGSPCAPVANGTRICNNGSCAIGACDTGYKDCNNKLSDGCEVNVTSDPANCNSCGNSCPIPTDGNAACTAGVCGLGSCKTGFANCDGNPANGCEKATNTDPNNCGGCGIKCGSGTCSGGKCTCNKNVLLIADDSQSGSATLASAITAAGYTVTQTTVPSYQYNGTNPALAGFGSVVLLAGGPASTSYATDMPAAGQSALVSFVNTSGNGLVVTEWAAYQVAAGRWQTLAPLVLLTRTAAYSGQVTYTVDAAFQSHPLWSGLASSFSIASTSNVGTTKIASYVTRAVSSPQAIDAVALRDAPVGRVVHVAHAGNYAPNGWTNTNVQKLMSNAVGWVARCQ